MAIYNTVNNIAISIFVYVVVNDLRLINPGFISLVAQNAGWTTEKAFTISQCVVKGFIVFVILMCAIDSISGFVKSRRLKLLSLNIDIK